MAKKRIEDFNSPEIKEARERVELAKREMELGSQFANQRQQILLTERYISEEKKLQEVIKNEINNLGDEELKNSQEILDELERQNKFLDTISGNLKKQNRETDTLRKSYSQINKFAKLTWDYLMQSDKAIRQTILSLGMSSQKADAMRTSFEQSAGFVARLGGDLGSIQTIMTTFANETGRARVLSADMVMDITKIGQGTGLGIENATRLAAQFEYMGVDIRRTMDYVQGVVETSELMGVNTTKVLNNITNNFKDLQKFTFQQGVKGFAQLASYAEKFSVDMNQALNVAEQARSLENAVDLAAQLQVMGGEFAKTDPFQLLFLSRNDPAEFTKKINEMTRGVVTFRKMADGSFEKYISPADRDRLAAVAKSLGMQTEELVEQSLRMADIQKMRQQMVGMGLTDKEKSLIEGMGTYDTKLNKFVVYVGAIKKDISDLTANELKILEIQNKSLEQRAMAAQTFDEAFKDTIAEFKTILLPILRGVNMVLEKVRPIAISFNEWLTGIAQTNNGLLKSVGIILSAGLLFKTTLGSLGGLVRGMGNLVSNKIGGASGSRGSRTIRGGIGKSLAGIGTGAAALGVGGGIALAASGISDLADAMSKLDADQAENLKSIVSSLTILSGVGIAASIGILAIGKAGQAGALGLLAFGGAALMVGGGIALAANSIANLIKETKGADVSMKNVARGVLDIGSSFRSIKSELRGSKENFKDIEKIVLNISRVNLNNLKSINKMNNLFDKPLKVEFADKEVALVSNITLNIDGEKFITKLNLAERIPIHQQNKIQGKG